MSIKGLQLPRSRFGFRSVGCAWHVEQASAKLGWPGLLPLSRDALDSRKERDGRSQYACQFR